MESSPTRFPHRHQCFTIVLIYELHDAFNQPVRCCECLTAVFFFLSFVRQVLITLFAVKRMVLKKATDFLGMLLLAECVGK